MKTVARLAVIILFMPFVALGFLWRLTYQRFEVGMNCYDAVAEYLG
jgi:hypothetical protein